MDDLIIIESESETEGQILQRQSSLQDNTESDTHLSKFSESSWQSESDL